MGEEVANWDPDAGHLGKVEKVKDEPDVIPAPRRQEHESVADFNQRLLKHFTQDLPKDQRHKEFSTVKKMQEYLPYTKDLLKLDPVPRPPGPGRP